jgi:hypothetical protein
MYYESLSVYEHTVNQVAASSHVYLDDHLQMQIQ